MKTNRTRDILPAALLAAATLLLLLFAVWTRPTPLLPQGQTVTIQELAVQPAGQAPAIYALTQDQQAAILSALDGYVYQKPFPLRPNLPAEDYFPQTNTYLALDLVAQGRYPYPIYLQLGPTSTVAYQSFGYDLNSSTLLHYGGLAPIRNGEALTQEVLAILGIS